MAACLGYFLATGTNLKLVAQLSMSYLYNSFTMIAVPLFIFAANIMNEGEITERVFGVAKGLVGRFPGGLGHVNVLASLIFSGMTGSAVADAAGLGKMEIEAMRKEGYDDGFSCAITAASAVIGPIFPPSIPMVIYSMISGASIGALFMGGIIPGVLLAIALMIYVAFVSHKRNYPTSKIPNKQKYFHYLISSIPALLTPVILLLGIYTGVVTATEAGAIAGLYALMVAVFGYHMMSRKQFINCVLDTIANSGAVLLTCGIAAVINYIVAKEQIATTMATWIMGVISNKYSFLILVNLVFLVLGMFIDTTVIQLVFVPLVIPMAQQFGIDLVHLGLVLCYNMMIGLATPPYGGLLFITSTISRTPLQDVIKEMLPMLVPMLLVLLVITYIPEVVLVLPKVLMHYVG
jgi:tripartite ATP-independent transporter DctM subunit